MEMEALTHTKNMVATYKGNQNVARACASVLEEERITIMSCTTDSILHTVGRVFLEVCVLYLIQLCTWKMLVAKICLR